MRRVLASLGLDWHPAVLDFQRSARVARTVSALQVRRGLYTSSVGAWERYGEQLRGLEAELLRHANLTARRGLAADPCADFPVDHRGESERVSE